MEEIQRYLSFASLILNVLLIPLITMVWKMSQQFSDYRHKIKELEDFKMQTTTQIREVQTELASVRSLIQNLKDSTAQSLVSLKEDFNSKLNQATASLIRITTLLDLRDKD